MSASHLRAVVMLIGCDSSIQNYIHLGNPDYVVTACSLPNFLYTNNCCDPRDLEIGLFHKLLLVKVSDLVFPLSHTKCFGRHSDSYSCHPHLLQMFC